MQYLVSRQGQTYGPYSIEELERYVGTGNVLLTDMAKSEGMPEYLPVSVILAQAGHAVPGAVAQPLPPYGAPQGFAPVAFGAASVDQYPDPPNLHWALVMLINVFTAGIFMAVWNCITAAWLRKVRPDSKVLLYYVVAYVLYFASIGFRFNEFVANFQAVQHPGMSVASDFSAATVIGGFLGLAHWVLKIVARFTEKSEMEEHFNRAEPLGLNMSGVMVFFFGGLYIQSEMSRIAQIKQSIRFQSGPRL